MLPGSRLEVPGVHFFPSCVFPRQGVLMVFAIRSVED